VEGNLSIPFSTQSVEKALDLNELLITHPVATFFVRASGDAMKGAAIFSGDLLIVDRSLTASDQNIIIAVFNAEFMLRRLIKRDQRLYLAPENPAYPIVEISKESNLEVWGVVTYVIHKTR
jgi:DNA polymerase V